MIVFYVTIIIIQKLFFYHFDCNNYVFANICSQKIHIPQKTLIKNTTTYLQQN